MRHPAATGEIPNQLDRAGLDSYEKGKSLKQNPDGTVDIYMGNDKPQGFESNWLPTAGEDFFVFFRLYGPAKSVYDKTWKAPDIERMNGPSPTKGTTGRKP